MLSPQRMRPPSERRRAVACAAVGLVVGALSSLLGEWELAVLVGCNVTATAFTWSVWHLLARADADRGIAVCPRFSATLEL